MKLREKNLTTPTCTRVRVQGLEYAGSRDFVNLYLEPPAWDYRPGQFVMVRPQGWEFDPLWARPFSVCEKTREYLRLFIQVVGRGTRLLRHAAPESEIYLWGPLGNGFKVPRDHPVLILAGGMGIAPFVGLCKTHPEPGNLSLIFGRSTDLDHYPFQELPPEMHKENHYQATSRDLEVFSAMLRDRIQGFASSGVVLACGPMPFLRAVQRHASEFSATAQLSVEMKMACGIGACLGCVVQTSDGEMVQSCAHGPVFDARELVLEA